MELGRVGKVPTVKSLFDRTGLYPRVSDTFPGLLFCHVDIDMADDAFAGC